MYKTLIIVHWSVTNESHNHTGGQIQDIRAETASLKTNTFVAAESGYIANDEGIVPSRTRALAPSRPIAEGHKPPWSEPRCRTYPDNNMKPDSAPGHITKSLKHVTRETMSGSSESESKSSDILSSSDTNPRQPQSTTTSSPPTSVAPSSSPAKSTGSPVIQWGSRANLGKRLVQDSHKRSAQYALYQNGMRDEDCDLPTKRLKTLHTTWNFTAASTDATNYLNQRMLELSRITRQAIATRIHYQRLRSRELDLIKSILEDETELCQTQLSGVDMQIGSIRNMLEAQGVTATGNTDSRFSPGNARLWYRSLSDEESLVIAATSRGSSACPQSDDSDV
ncbi:uncharacterized protein F5891DRAFT_991475 [Suillus fuscotomentosus]|uniref:Uncharacterized protein n=1 Tax=Suillus fuscotomentosus TaxID=1912939 RepID=A0AAD4DP21_9AGAM|nr:uncharacterized protein F5891DRAFT_991475 [Suillus fuscotomentosus]KAG1879961.1 hypothetical protein F5891DRAFT_991475 [Suillus fuscotomentosus]